MKHCSRCDKDKVESEFHKSRATKDGLSAYCKKCNAEYQRDYLQAKHPDSGVTIHHPREIRYFNTQTQRQQATA